MPVRFKIVKDINGVLQWLRLGDYELEPVQNSPEVEKNEKNQAED